MGGQGGLGEPGSAQQVGCQHGQEQDSGRVGQTQQDRVQLSPQGCLEPPTPSLWGLSLSLAGSPGAIALVSVGVSTCWRGGSQPSCWPPFPNLPPPLSDGLLLAAAGVHQPGVTVVFVLPQSYFLSRAQSLCGPERSAVPDSLRWLCHPLGQKFFMERSWSVKLAAKESLYCAQRNPGENALAPGGSRCCPQTHGDTGCLGREFLTLRSL